MNFDKEKKIFDLSGGSTDLTQYIKYENGFSCYKKTANANGIDKMKKQIEWLQKAEKILPVAKIIDVSETASELSYCMEYPGKTKKLSELLLDRKVPLKKGKELIDKTFRMLNEKLYNDFMSEVDLAYIVAYKNVKIDKNINFICENLKISNDVVSVNGHQYPSILEFASLFELNRLFDIFRNEKVVMAHGDLTAENIIVLMKNEEPYLIDPNSGNYIESQEMDYGKFMQSLHGQYEILMNDATASVSGSNIEVNVNYIQEKRYTVYWEYFKKNYLEKLPPKRILSCYYHEAVHWLRLMPYKIKSGYKPEAFYARLLYLLENLSHITKEFGK